MALAKKFRLKLQRDFEKISEKGEFNRVAGLDIKYIPNQLDHTRISVIISKKTSKKAVTRNKARRRILEIIRPLLKNLSGYDIIFFPKKEILEKDFSEVKKAVELLLKKSNLI